MTTIEVVLLVVVLLVVVGAVAAAVVLRNRKRAQLQSTFGPEYDRTVERTGGRRNAERELAERAERRRSLDIRPLPETDRLAYAERWRSTQADFVDRPSEAVRAADRLVTEVMAKRGYPVDDVDQMARDVSVDHADTVEEYRSAQAISQLNDRHQASTEQLRQAMVHYRALFDDLLTDPRHADSPAGGATTSDERGRLREDRVPDDHRDDEAGLHDERGRHEERDRHDERVAADGRGDGTDEDRRADDGAGRERVEVVHVEREPLPGASTGSPDDGRAATTRVEPGGLLAGREPQGGPGRSGSQPDSLVRGGVGHRADGEQPDADGDRPREDRPRT